MRPHKLLHSKDVPKYLSTNPYLTYGYRSCSTYSQCLYSLSYWSISQWSSITSIMFSLYGIILIYYGSYSNQEGVSYVIYSMGTKALLPSIPSACYHIFGEAVGMGEKVFLFFQKLDFIMIHVSSIPLAYSLSIGVSYPYQDYYMLPYLTCFLSTIQSIIVYNNIDYITKPIHRLISMFFIVNIYLIPVYTMWSIELFSLQSLCGFGIIFFLGLGGYVYYKQYPECYYENHWFGSHALMHICIQSAFFFELTFSLLGVTK